MEFLPFFLVLLTGVLFSIVFRRFHLPWVLALIAGGMVLGPYGLHLVETNTTIDFISQIGLVFLMFMAGLETKLSTFKEFGRGIAWLSFLNAAIPFFAGFGIAWFFGFPLLSALLLGIIFMSSSIAVIIPTLESANIIDTKLGRSIISATIVEDVASLVLLSVLLQTLSPATVLPLPSFYILLAVLLFSFKYGIPKLRQYISSKLSDGDLFETEVRVVIALLIGVVVIFELLGLHAIIAGFFTGLVLSDSITNEKLIDKLRTIAYGIFIPSFFVNIGMKTNIWVFADGIHNLGIALTIIAGSMTAKFGSGWVGARLIGLQNKDALTVGIATIPQLSTTLAVVYTAVEMGLLQSKLITTMVMLSIVTTFIAPTLIRFMYPAKVH